jgi:hypothetical protein
MPDRFAALSDAILRLIVIATDYDPTFLRVNKRTYGLDCGIGAHWLRQLISACDTKPRGSDEKPTVRIATSTHRARNRAFPGNFHSIRARVQIAICRFCGVQSRSSTSRPSRSTPGA